MYESPKIIAEVGAFLREPLPRIPEDLEAHIIGLDALRFELAQATADWLKLLYDKRRQMLWPKDTDKKMTELDRNVHLHADVSVIERDYHFLEALTKLVEQRLDLAMKFIED